LEWLLSWKRLKRTNVAQKTDAFAKRNEGLALAKEIFVNKDASGIPLSHRIVVKPNLTCSSGGADIESGMGIVTDPDFVEGVIEGIKELGLTGEQFHLIELNCPGDWSMRGYPQMAARTGAHLRDLDRDVKQLKEGEDITWVDCPGGVVFKRIGYLAPVNQPDTWLLNVARWKTHGMGLTLCCKNQQGMCANPWTLVGGTRTWELRLLPYCKRTKTIRCAESNGCAGVFVGKRRSRSYTAYKF